MTVYCVTEHNTGMGVAMSKTKAEGIVAQLLANAVDLQYGSVTVTVKMHEGKVATVSYSKTENTREQEINAEKQIETE